MKLSVIKKNPPPTPRPRNNRRTKETIMPRLKPSPQEDRNRIIRAIIVCNQERYALSDESVAKYLNMSLATFRKKKARPVNFDLMDIHALSRYLKFTPYRRRTLPLGGISRQRK